MTTPFICVFIAFLFLFVTKLPIAVAQHRLGGYDNKHPRQQQAKLEGFGARALSAHKNAFEAFGPFAAAVIIAHLMQADPHRSSVLAITFLVARVGYEIAYLVNIDYLRTFLWFIGLLSTIGLFLIAL